MSNNYEVFQRDHNTICLVGEVNFDNVKTIRGKGRDIIDTLQEIKIDLAKLQSSDSSGLVLLTAWVRDARQQHKVISIHNVPAFIMALSRVCGINMILPLAFEG